VKDVDLPNGWAAAGLGEIAGVNPRTFRTDVTPDTEVSFVPMAAVEAGSGLLDASDIQLWGDLARRSYTRFAEGDVLFAKITPCMENGKFARRDSRTAPELAPQSFTLSDARQGSTQSTSSTSSSKSR